MSYNNVEKFEKVETTIELLRGTKEILDTLERKLEHEIKKVQSRAPGVQSAMDKIPQAELERSAKTACVDLRKALETLDPYL